MKTSILTNPLLICGVFAMAATIATASTAQAAPSAPAAAPEQEQVYEDFAFKFTYTQSELESAKGAERLLSRLQSKVKDYCDTGGRSVPDKRKSWECVDRTMGNAIHKFGSSTLTQVFQSRAAG
jgi:UrcA family protein